MADKNKPLGMYEMQFDVQERKAFIAESLRTMRTAKGHKQADVASWIGISPQTYNGYEKGRNEPPAEMLVRLAYLYDVPLDLLVQRDRLHGMNESAMETINRFDEELARVQEELKNSKYKENIQLDGLLKVMQQMVKLMKKSAEKNKM